MTAQTDSGPSLFTRSFASLLVAQAAFGYSSSAFYLLPKYLTVELLAGPSQIGLVSAVGGGATILSLFATGAYVDRFGRRHFMRAGSVLMALSALAFAAVDRIGFLIYALRAIQGASFAMAFVAGATLAVEQAPPERLGQAIGIYGLTGLSMNAVAPTVVENVAEHSGWALAFMSAAAGAALSFVLVWLVSERSRPRAAGSGPGLLDVARQPRLMLISLIIGLVGAAFGSVFTFSQPLAIKVGIQKVRGFFIAYAAAAFGARVGLGRAADRLGRYPVSAFSLACYTLAVFLMIWLRPGWLAPLGAFFGFAHGLFYPAFNALAVEDANPLERSKVMALFQGWFNVGSTVGVLLFGFIAATAGYTAVFITAGLISLGAFVLLAASPAGRALSSKPIRTN